MNIRLYNDDCFNIFEHLRDEGIKIDAVITDIPYGTTPLKWDTILPAERMWQCVHSICNDDTPIVLFGQEPFSSYVRLSNIDEYKYDWYWQKERLTNVFQVKRRPGKVCENVMVFYKTQCKYNPQKTIYTGPKRTNKIGSDARFSITQRGSGNIRPLEYNDDGTRYPLEIIKFKRDSMYDIRYHPTQKPIELMRYLVKTYTDENDTVLDFTMGCGSTGIACVLENRNFIGIEIDKTYFDIAEKRINDAKNNII